MPLFLPRLYPILDASFLPAENRTAFLMQLVEELAVAGVSLLQYRNKSDNESKILADASLIRASAAARMTLIMNDHPELAVKAAFDGVHVGQEDLSAAEARKIVGDQRIVGVSTHNRSQLEAADSLPVDYVAIGPVYATSSKLNPDPLVGLDGVREARSLTRKPLVAIGGIVLENASAVIQAGADSVAVISAVFGPGAAPAERVGKFLERLHQ